MDSAQSRIRHASIESRPYGASISSVVETRRHHRFPSPKLDDETFIHVDPSWPSPDNGATPRSAPICERATTLFTKQMEWIRQHTVRSVIIAIAILLLLVLIATGVVLVLTVNAGDSSSSFAEKTFPPPTPGTTPVTPQYEPPFAIFPILLALPENVTHIQSFEPCRRHHGNFLAVGNQTLLTFSCKADYPELTVLRLHALNIDRKNCSTCHVFDRRGDHHDSLYCCTGCSDISFFCSYYGLLVQETSDEQFLSARLFPEGDTFNFHYVTKVEDVAQSKTYLRLHRAVISDNSSHPPELYHGPLQKGSSDFKFGNYSAFSYAQSEHLDWKTVLYPNATDMKISNFDESEKYVIGNFMRTKNTGSTSLYMEGAAKPSGNSYVAAVSQNDFAIAQFSEKGCEYGNGNYDAYGMELSGAVILGSTLFVGHYNATNILMRVIEVSWK